MAQGDRSLATFKPGRRGPFLFPRPNPNFSSGRYRPPSKNLQQQPTLFRSRDPYAAGGSRVMQATLGGQFGGPDLNALMKANPALATAYGQFGQPGGRGIGAIGQAVQGASMRGISGLPAGGVAGGPGFQMPGALPGGGAAAGPGFQPPQQLPPGAGVGGGYGPPGAGLAGLRGLESFAGMSPEDLAAIREIGAGPMNVQNPAIMNAARLAAGAMRGNPFIDREELLRMARGFAPLEQGINPAFYRYTSPVIQQTLQGLRTSVGYRPEEQEFMANLFTPRGL